MLKTSYKVEQEVDELAQEALDKYDIEESDEEVFGDAWHSIPEIHDRMIKLYTTEDKEEYKDNLKEIYDYLDLWAKDYKANSEE